MTLWPIGTDLFTGETPALDPVTYRQYRSPERTDLPVDLLSYLDKAWAQRVRFSQAASLPTEVGIEVFSQFEQDLTMNAGVEAAKRNLTLLTTTGPVWTVLPFSGVPPTVKHDEATSQEHSWRPGTPLPEGMQYLAVCRISGWAVPTFAEESR